MFSSIFITSFIALVQSEVNILGHWHWFNMGYIGIRNMVLRPCLYTTHLLVRGWPESGSTARWLLWRVVKLSSFLRTYPLVWWFLLTQRVLLDIIETEN